MCSRQLSQKELKLKEEFSKCGLEEFCVSSATMSTSANLFVVAKPALYKIKNTNSYLLFGDPMDYSNVMRQIQESAKDPEALRKMMGGVMEEPVTEVTDEAVPAAVQASEVNEDDVTLIMNESKLSREDAVRALAEANNDVIQALVNINKK